MTASADAPRESPPAAPPLGTSPGVDVVSVDRLAAALARTPGLLARVFTEREVADATRGEVAIDHPAAARRLAARFAAKEAFRKASGLRLRWRDVEVRSDAPGDPHLWVRDAPAPAHVSLAHDAGVAIAMVIATRPSDLS